MKWANFAKKFSGYFLPKEIDFFGNLRNQSKAAHEVLQVLLQVYVENSKSADELVEAINDAYTLRKKNLVELNTVLITPFDKEAISRMYITLDWVVLSVRHLHAEISAFETSPISKYSSLFHNLTLQMTKVTTCFTLMQEKKYAQVVDEIEAIIDMDDDLIGEYSKQLKELFERDSVKFILREQEILKQLKEISKRIHVCANTIEDVVSRLN